MSKKDISEIKKFDPPGLKLVGFKNKEFLKPYHNISHSYFVHCDEERVKGSSQFFDALISQLIAKSKIGIAKIVTKSNSAIRFCALLPQAEIFDENNFQIPPGFNLIFLPYFDDLRTTIPFENPPTQISNSKLSCAKLLVNTFTSDEADCRDFENPAIQNFYTKLQALALETDTTDEMEDLLEPDVKGMDRYSSLLENFQNTFSITKDLVYPDGKAKDARKRRPAPTPISKKSSVYSKINKKRNSEIADLDLEDIDFDDINEEETTKTSTRRTRNPASKSKGEIDSKFIEDCLANGDPSLVTVPQLKEYIRLQGQMPSGAKADLFDQAQNLMVNKL